MTWKIRFVLHVFAVQEQESSGGSAASDGYGQGLLEALSVVH